ncbi:methionyl-tRNA formyltransferase, partial [Candidatus Sumerlaeota bacterium]
MRVIFMGTPQFAIPTLERLLDSSHQVVAAISQPDRRAGRGQHVKPTPVKETAQLAGIPVLQPESVRTPEFLALLQELEPQVIVVVAYGKILPEPVLTLPEYGCLNVHASLLPKYRGAAPVQWAIINGERKSGVTIMQMDVGMDTGNIIRQQEVDVLDDDDAISLGDMLSVVGAKCLLDSLDEIEQTQVVASTPQDNEQATRAPLLTKEDGHLDWEQDPEAIICRIVGLKPWPGAFGETAKGTFRFLRAISFYPEEAETFLSRDQEVGEVIDLLSDRGPVVRT